MNIFKNLLTSRRFWMAAVAVIVTAIGVAFPQFPKPLVEAFQVFALALIAAFTVEDSARFAGKGYSK